MNEPPLPSRLGCVLPLFFAACGAVALGWWRSEAAWDEPARSLFDQTPMAVAWLGVWMCLGALVGFAVGVIVVKCVVWRRTKG